VNADLTGIDFNKAKAFEDPLVYAARIIEGKDGWYLIGFVNEVNDEFVGELCDPVPVTATVESGLVRR
jgi:beta-fructofuranosidase